MGGSRRRARRRHRSAAAGRDGSTRGAPSWEGDSGLTLNHQTPKGLRRIVADGSPPDPIPLALTWRSSGTPERVVVHAGSVDGVLEAVRGESDIVIESGVIRNIDVHRDELHTGAVVDASNEYVMPGLVEMHAHLDDGYGENFGRVWLAYGITSLRIPQINPCAGLEQREAFDGGRAARPAGVPRRRSVRRRASTTRRRIGDVGRAARSQLDRASTLGVDFFRPRCGCPDRFSKRIVEFRARLRAGR